MDWSDHQAKKAWKKYYEAIGPYHPTDPNYRQRVASAWKELEQELNRLEKHRAQVDVGW